MFYKTKIILILLFSFLYCGQLSFFPKNGNKGLILQDNNIVNVSGNLIVAETQYAYPASGIIAIWSGPITSIPAGWVLCNGANGTPDLRNRFIVGAGNNYVVGNTGGANTVVLTTAQLPAHSHTMSEDGAHRHVYLDQYPVNPYGGTYRIRNADKEDDFSGREYSTEEAGSHKHTLVDSGNGEAHENRPPYYALAFIMKL